MEHKTETEVKVTLILNRREAEFINRLMQNAIWLSDPDQEPEEEKALRIAFFNATKLPNKIGFGQ